MFEAGTYVMKVTNSCGQDTTLSLTVNSFSHEPFTYTLGEESNTGAKLYPSGRIMQKNGATFVETPYSSGTYGTYYYILSGPGINPNTQPRIQPGGYLELSDSGTYTIAMSPGNGTSYGVFATMEVEYTKQPLEAGLNEPIGYESSN
jgi:hypothetical protein